MKHLWITPQKETEQPYQTLITRFQPEESQDDICQFLCIVSLLHGLHPSRDWPATESTRRLRIPQRCCRPKSRIWLHHLPIKGISSDFTANWPFNSYFMFHHTLSRRFLPRTIFLDRKVIFYRGIYMVLARLRREKLFQDLKNVSTTTSMLHSFIDSKFATLHFIALQIWFRLVPHQFIVRSEFYKF